MFLFFYFKLYSFLLHFSFVLVSKFVQKNATNAQLFVKGVDHCTHFLSLSLNSGWARSLKRQTILSKLLMNIDILTPTPRHTHSLIAAIVLLLQLFAQIFPGKDFFFEKLHLVPTLFTVTASTPNCKSDFFPTLLMNPDLKA